MDKIPIAAGSMKGNLQSLVQEYSIFYLPREGEYDPKLELSILLIAKDNTKREYRSIRFTNLAQIKDLIIGLIKGYFFFGFKNGEIKNINFRYRLTKFWEDIVRAIQRQ